MAKFVNEFTKQLLLISWIDVMKPVNEIIKSIFNSSIININFNHPITFSIVGILLTMMGSPRGKVGCIIGKIFYLIVSYIVEFILNNMSEKIF